MQHLLSFLPYPITIIIFIVGLVISVFTVVKFHAYLRFAGTTGFIMLGLTCLFGILLKTIMSFHVIEHMMGVVFTLLLISLLLCVILIIIQAYIVFFQKNTKIKTAFWIYISVLIILITITITFIVIANHHH